MRITTYKPASCLTPGCRVSAAPFTANRHRRRPSFIQRRPTHKLKPVSADFKLLIQPVHTQPSSLASLSSHIPQKKAPESFVGDDNGDNGGGDLRQFAGAVRADVALCDDPCSILLHADDVQLDGFVTAVDGGEELRPGELYFAVPRSFVKRRLRGEEVRELVAKAGAALDKAGVMLEPYGEQRRGVVDERGFSPQLVAVPEEETVLAPQNRCYMNKRSCRQRLFLC